MGVIKEMKSLTIGIGLILVVVGSGCSETKSTEQIVAEASYWNEDIWSCDTRKEPNCMENIYHFGYKRDGTFYVWRKGDMMPSTVCDPRLKCSR